MRTYNTEEALKLLKECYLGETTEHVRRLIRQKKLKAVSSSNRQKGNAISESDLFEYIEQERPGLLDILRVYHNYSASLDLELKNILNHTINEDGDVLPSLNSTVPVVSYPVNQSNKSENLLEMDEENYFYEPEQSDASEKIVNSIEPVEEVDIGFNNCDLDNNFEVDRTVEKIVGNEFLFDENTQGTTVTKLLESIIVSQQEMLELFKQTLNGKNSLLSGEMEKKTFTLGNANQKKTLDKFTNFIINEIWNQNERKADKHDRASLGKILKRDYSFFYNDEEFFRNENVVEKDGVYKLIYNRGDVPLELIGNNIKKILEAYVTLVLESKLSKINEETSGGINDQINLHTLSLYNETGDTVVKESEQEVEESLENK